MIIFASRQVHIYKSVIFKGCVLQNSVRTLKTSPLKLSKGGNEFKRLLGLAKPDRNKLASK